MWKLFKTAGWAPFLVVVFHRIVLESGLRAYPVCDWILHFSGGLAIAFFLFHVIVYYKSLIGELPEVAHLLLTFTAACTVAAFWELAEFGYSFIRGTTLQHSITETMIDLFNSCLGAAVTVAILAFRLWRQKKI